MHTLITRSVTVSYLEIYNEALYDLLAESPGATSDALAIMDDAVAGGTCNVRPASFQLSFTCKRLT